MSDRIVIVGAGQAGLQVADTLRQEKYAGEVLLLGDEAHAPYNRPPLSKKWLLERPPVTSLYLRGLEALQRRNIDWRGGTRVAAIDRAAKRLQLADGQSIDYTGLALATGSTLRWLPLPGADLAGVHGLRGIEHAQVLADALDRSAANQQAVVVIGGGFIGLEVAASARKRGLQVLVLESLSRLMSRVVAPIVSDAAARVHESHGVEILYDVKVEAILGHEGVVRAVRLADGREFPAGMVVLGVGVNPDDALAREAGVACERGIIVDDCSRTNDPCIVAAGDCAARRMADGNLRRLESVQNAVEQGKAAAYSLLGQSRPFTATPWFWSDQYDLRLQMVGLSQGYDQVVTRGDVAKPAFSAFYYRGPQLIAVDSLSRIQDHMTARKLLDRGVSPTPAQAADENFSLQSLLAA